MDTNNKSNIQKESDKKLNNVKKVLGILFSVIVLVLSCFIYANCKESNASQSSMYETEQQQIAEMTEYLSGIDESVSTNMEQLAQAAVMQTNAEGTLKEVTNTLSGMEKQITEVEKVLSDTVIENMDSSTTVLKESLSETKTELVNQIEAGNKEISDILSDMNDENNNNFQETYIKIENLQSQLEAVEKSMENYYKDLTALINEFQKQNTEEHKEILDALLKAQEELNEYLDNSFESLNLRLDEDMSNLMDELTVLHNQIITTQNNLTDILNIMEQNDSERQEEVKNMFADTKNYLSYIEETFADAHSKLQNIIIKFQEMEKANHSETLNVLQVMENDMQETTENGFQNLAETMNSFETSLNNTLDTMQENIFSSFLNTNSKMESSFQSMNENIDNKFSETNETLNQNFQDIKDDMIQNFTDLNTNITTENDEMTNSINNNVNEKVANLTTTINNYNTLQGESLDELKQYLNEQLTQVFTSVSNGKASLASALLTKGIDLGKEDATFAEIYDGIMRSPAVDPSIAATADNISQGKGAWVNGELIIGNGADNKTSYNQGYSDGLNKALNGASISYVYHQHTDACIRTCTFTQYTSKSYAGFSHEEGVACGGHGSMYKCIIGQRGHECGHNWEHSGYYCSTCSNIDDYGGSRDSSHTYYTCGKTESTIESAVITFK